jgi:hypothetical protein
MARSLEDIVGKIEREPVLPGTGPRRADKVRYVSFAPLSRPADVFDEVVCKIDPPIVKGGGVSLDNWIVTIPDGTPFYALEYHDDVKGWQLQIERGAHECGVLSAKIEGQQFVVSDGRSYLLSECVAQYEPGLSVS